MTRRPLVPAALVTRLPIITALSALWVAGWALTTAGRDRPAPWVATVDRHIQHVLAPLRGVAQQSADLASPGRLAVIVVVLVAICLIGRSPTAVAAAAVSMVGELVVVEVILKPLVDSRLAPGDSTSYPSGHTATAVCLGTLVVLLVGRRSGPLRLALPRVLRVILAALGVAVGPVVGVSMISTGAHTFIDVLGALPLGATVTIFMGAGIDRLRSTDQPPIAGVGSDKRSMADTAVAFEPSEPSTIQAPTTPS